MLQTCRSFNAHEPVLLLLIVGGVFVPPMKCRDLMDDFYSNPESGAEHLKQGLSDWFAGHFSTFDARLHGHLEH